MTVKYVRADAVRLPLSILIVTLVMQCIRARRAVVVEDHAVVVARASSAPRIRSGRTDDPNSACSNSAGHAVEVARVDFGTRTRGSGS